MHCNNRKTNKNSINERIKLKDENNIIMKNINIQKMYFSNKIKVWR
jgi:pectate lyase